MTLLLHYPAAGKTELQAAVSVDTVVDTSVAGYITAGHAAVGRIDYGIYPEGGDITSPKIQAAVQRRRLKI